MTIFTRILSAGISACGGGLVLYTYNNNWFDNLKVNASWTTNFTPSAKWDSNWDRRDPTSIVKPPKGKEDDNSRYNNELEQAKPTAKRHIFLIRHGQYNLDGKHDSDRVLTKLGREQAMLTGKRLQEFGHNYTHLIVSTMTRAKETAALIQQSLPEDLTPTFCPMLEEGAPIPPEPPIGDWRPEPYFFEDGARIEAAFRKHIHRADVKQKNDSYEVVVCHANVIRYFVCRALQVPGEAWLRMSLHHASITGLTILPSGRVVLRTVSDSGHLPPSLVTTS